MVQHILIHYCLLNNPVIFIFVLRVDEVCGEDDQEDTEYNFMAEDQKEEKEEYRNDRAVRIPRK